MTHPLEIALFHADRRHEYDKAQKIAAALELGELHVFSGRQISVIVSLPHTEVSKLISKADKTGGKITIAALRPLLRVAQLRRLGEVDVFAVKEARDAGVSSWLAAKLTGVPRRTLDRWLDRAESMTREDA